MTVAVSACKGFAACGSAQDALGPTGDAAGAIAWVWWLFFAICTLTFLAVVVALSWAVLRARSNAAPSAVAPEVHPSPERERQTARVIAAAVAVTVAILFVFTISSFVVDRDLFAHTGSGDVNIHLIGHQWWWEVRYESGTPSESFITANEIHIPVGKLVKVTLDSRDVIHSFWVPNLAGKMDLIPGQQNTTWITARRAGLYRGQCAEFCGLQHAHMAFILRAEDDAAYQNWVARQRRQAPEPTTNDERTGQQVFLSGPCVLCHTIRGTTAGAIMGPDLTHVESRLTLGAGTLPNTRGHLAGWIIDAQAQKPGNAMPPNVLAGEAVQALLSYLDTLQ